MQNFVTTLALIAEIVPPVVSRAPRTYPFVGQNACRAALKESAELQRLMMVALWHCQTEQEKVRRDTEEDNKRGFMSSHAWHGSRIAEAIASGKELAPEDQDRVAKYSVVYAKQLAAMLRSYAIGLEPELGVSARVFGI